MAFNKIIGSQSYTISSQEPHSVYNTLRSRLIQQSKIYTILGAAYIKLRDELAACSIVERFGAVAYRYFKLHPCHN